MGVRSSGSSGSSGSTGDVRRSSFRWQLAGSSVRGRLSWSGSWSSWLFLSLAWGYALLSGFVMILLLRHSCFFVSCCRLMENVFRTGCAKDVHKIIKIT
jgi:hypothetical protein